MMDIVLILITGALAAITTFLGVRSRDTQRFTTLGWVAVILSIFALVGNIYEAYAKRRESEQLRATIEKQSHRLSDKDFALWLLIDVPGYEPTPDAASEAHRLHGLLAEKTFTITIRATVTPEHLKGGRGKHGETFYRFRSDAFDFDDLGELFLEDLQGKTMKIECDPQTLGFSTEPARCWGDLFVKGKHFQAKSAAKSIEIFFDSL